MTEDGVLEWRDASGELHRDGAPARVFPGGREEWYRHGKLHRVGGSAVIHANGSVKYSEVTPQPPPAAGAVTVGKGPAKKTTKKTATFEFSAANAASFQCSLDGKPLAPCSSPLKLKKLKKGKHTLDIRAIGADGQPGATTHYAWKVKKKKKK